MQTELEGRREAAFSFVNEYPPAEPEAARAHFLARLAFETDPADVKLDLERTPERIHVIDVRPRKAYEACHVPGAISLPYRTISRETTAGLDPARTLVVYCWGPNCNAAHKGAARLENVDDATHTATIVGNGRDTRGQGNASATIRMSLAPDGDGTRVEIVTDLSVTGKVAQFGRGVMADVSAKKCTPHNTMTSASVRAAWRDRPSESPTYSATSCTSGR